MHGLTLFTIEYESLEFAGGCTALGVRVGDRILNHYRPAGTTDGAYFENTVSVDDEIQQLYDAPSPIGSMTAVVLRTL